MPDDAPTPTAVALDLVGDAPNRVGAPKAQDDLRAATWNWYLDRPYRAPDVTIARYVVRNASWFCRTAYEIAEREWAREDREAVLFEAERAIYGLA